MKVARTVLGGTLLLSAFSGKQAGQVNAAANMSKDQTSQTFPAGQPPILPLLPMQIPFSELMPNLTQRLAPVAHEQTLFPFKESDIKFKLDDLAAVLSDSRHESMVLTAYPDPVTKLPLIGAGFSLRIPKTPPHVLGDPNDPFQVNGQMRIEPDTESLWVAAGLKKEDLDRILKQFDERMEKLHASKASAKTIAKKFSALVQSGEFAADITPADAQQLSRIAAMQASYNAKFYCPQVFDKMTASQQMGMAHLVYQMGPHLEKFTHFIGALNNAEAMAQNADNLTEKYWQGVQRGLIDSQWFKKYNLRATAVIAMFRPDYDFSNPHAAELKVKALAHGGNPRKTFTELAVGGHKQDGSSKHIRKDTHHGAHRG